jgi:membrane fusion protein (multidrug efflux system)
MLKSVPKPSDVASEMKPKNSLKPLLGTVAGLIVATLAGLYLYYYSFHETTDDAFTTGHVHSISTRVSGTVLEVAVDDNQTVKKGQLLVRLDPSDYQVVVDKAQADYDRTVADFARETHLLNSGAISRQEFDTAKAALGVAKANLDMPRISLAIATSSLQPTA